MEDSIVENLFGIAVIEKAMQYAELMKSLSDKLVLSVLFAVYEITSEDENVYASIEQICELTDLTEDIVVSSLDGGLSQYCERTDKQTFRIKGAYMNIPPILSILYPVL